MENKTGLIKILYVITSLKPGGAEKLIEESLPIMKINHNIDVEVLLLTDKGNIFDKKLKYNNIKIYVSPHKKIRSIKNLFYLLNHFKKNRYDIVHSHLFPCNYFVAIASKLIFTQKPKLITTEHNTHNKRRNKFYYRPIEKFVYSIYDYVVSISEGTEQALLNWINPKFSKKFIVIENGINLEEFINALPYNKTYLDNRFDNSSKLLVMVGSFSKQKDQSTIIRAMKDLSEDTFLILVGEGPMRLKNEYLAKELKVEERVNFLGIRSDVPRILKSSDIVILSSNWEGFGLAAAEGMASRKPVIASNVSGLAEMVKGAGFLYEKGNSIILKDMILSLLNNKTRYDIVAEKCYERSKKYDINRMVQEYLNIYHLSLINNITKRDLK